MILPPVLLVCELGGVGVPIGPPSGDAVVTLDRDGEISEIPAVTVETDMEPPDKISVVTTVENLVGGSGCSVGSVIAGVSVVPPISVVPVVSVVSVTLGLEVLLGLAFMGVVDLRRVEACVVVVGAVVSPPPSTNPGVKGCVSRATKSSSFHRICIAGPTVQSTLFPLVWPATVYPQTPPRKSDVSVVQV